MQESQETPETDQKVKLEVKVFMKVKVKRKI